MGMFAGNLIDSALRKQCVSFLIASIFLCEIKRYINSWKLGGVVLEVLDEKVRNNSLCEWDWK